MKVDSNKVNNSLIIHKCRQPRCFGKSFNPQSISYYFYNTKAWMTMTIWEDWLVQINNDFRRRSRKVLLLVDNAPGPGVHQKVYFRH